MRLDRLDLTRYGRFTDTRLDFPRPEAGSPDLHLIYGPNEAGKSTLFSAWLDLLYGIPLRTRYDFLHEGRAMQIGAVLSHAGGALELRRLKRNSASLLDGHNAPLPEGSLQALLGGLPREGYTAMFSLDEETLVRGGEGILDSKGDLGQMLFSASAGLSGLVPRLEELRSGLDSFYNGKRSGWLPEAKKQLAALESRRRAGEITLAKLQQLTRDSQSAGEAWQAARTSSLEAAQKLEDLTRRAAGLPLLRHLAALQERLAPLAHLPEAGEEEAATWADLENRRRELQSRESARALRLASLREQLAALRPDPAILALAEDIAATEAGRAAHDTALQDLPAREEKLATLHAELATGFARLGLTGPAPEAELLPSPRLSQLRALLARRSGVESALRSAEAEYRNAAQLLADETGRSRAEDPAGDAAGDDSLAALVARLRAADPTAADHLSRRELDQARARLDSALRALAPWRGTAEALEALDPPTEEQITAWEAGLDAALAARTEAGHRMAALRRDAEEAESAAEGLREAAAAVGVNLEAAAQQRSRREALWARHRSTLTGETAEEFEQALREDDRISALLAEAMAAARRAAQLDSGAAQLRQRIREAEENLAAADRTHERLTAEVTAATRELGLGSAAPARLRSWLALRRHALEALDQSRAALRARDRAAANLSEAAELLAHSLSRAPAPFEVLLAAAIARLDAAGQRREARLRRSALTRDLERRAEARTAAAARMAEWQSDWAAGVQGSFLAGLAPETSDLSTTLDELDRLREIRSEAVALADRVQKMQQNRDRTRAERQRILSRLDAAAGTGWPEITQRLQLARDTARDQQRLEGEIRAEEQAERGDARAMDQCRTEEAALGRALNWQPEAGPLGAHLEACRTASALRQEIRGLQSDPDVPAELPPMTAAEEHDLRAEIAAARAALDQLQAETDAAQTRHLTLRAELESQGSDDSLAQIAAERQTLLLEMAERSRDWLTRRLGLTALDFGLRRYREEHRSSMLSRASAAFAELSGGAYSGLATQPDGEREVLVARSADGPSRLAAQLSKATRFQLYLALRIAGYHELAQSRSPVPFIADDIFESFDDRRATAAFRLLGEMAQTGQVIYLTHHRHLCHIAQEACPGVRIHQLSAAEPA